MNEPGSRREQILDAAEKDMKRRRRERAGIIIAGLLLVGVLYLVFRFSHAAQESTFIQPFVIYFFNFAIWALILLLILVLFFLIVRNVVKYAVERRRSRLRFRLVMAFVSLTVLPAAVLFLLASFILNTSIERLYSPHILNVVETSKDVIESSSRISEAAREIVEGKYEADGEDSVHFAQELARGILERGWVGVVAGDESPEREVADGDTSSGSAPVAGDTAGPAPGDGDTAAKASVPPAREQLFHYIDFKRQEYGLAMAVVFDKSGKVVARSAMEGMDFPEVQSADIERTLEGAQGFNPPQFMGEGAVIYAFYPIPRRLSSEQEAEIVGAVLAARYVSWIPEREWHELSVAEEAREQIEDFETLSRLELPISFVYYMLLVFVTLIVIFLAVWFGFYMAKTITEPIQLLAEGTEMVASGKLDYKIEIASEGSDEISILVRSFNKMTEDLSISRFNLDQAYHSLSESNLELEQRRSYMETVLAQVTAGVISVDHEETVSTINPSALRMLVRSDKDQVVGVPLSRLLRSEELDLCRRLAAELEESGGSIAQRQLSIFREDRSFVVLISVSPLRDERGDSLGMVIMIEDMTDLIRAHRAMAWREVARRIAHEIKNPLTPIQLAAQRLERRYADSMSGEEADVFRRSIRTIIRQVEQLKYLVNEFSLFARLPSTNPVPHDLHQIIDEVLPLYREAHSRVEFKVIKDKRLPKLEIDNEQMKRALINLIDNALASIEGPGEIAIETMYNEKLQIVRMEIRDSGHGIPAYVKDRLFEPYYSTKHGGTGLGLTIVQRIIADHYGYIRVVDNEPRGTTMIIELPVILAERRVAEGETAKTM